MKKNRLFIISALVISGVFFSVLSLFELSSVEWLISDVILGVVLYASYFAIASAWGESKLTYSSFLRKPVTQE